MSELDTRDYLRVHVAVALLAGCGDNVAPIDVAPPLPDLVLVGAEMEGTTVIADTAFNAQACEIAEGCVAVPGLRRLLRFATVTENIGAGDLSLGTVPPAGVSDGIFVWSPCHLHHHIAGYADYELRDATRVVAAGHKRGFCLEDDEQVDPSRGPSHGYDCNFQGLSVGWADVYGNSLPCQWIDITGLSSGTYTLRVVVNASGVLPDADPTNNEWLTSVTF